MRGGERFGDRLKRCSSEIQWERGRGSHEIRLLALEISRAPGHAGRRVEVVLGLVIALAIGLTGVGAGTLTAPALILWFDVPPAIAVGTALAFGATVKLPAVASYLMRKQVDFRAFRSMAIGGIPGVVLGGLVLHWLDQGRLRGVVLLIVGVVVVVSALFSLFRRHAAEGPINGAVGGAGACRKGSAL